MVFSDFEGFEAPKITEKLMQKRVGKEGRQKMPPDRVRTTILAPFWSGFGLQNRCKIEKIAKKMKLKFGWIFLSISVVTVGCLGGPSAAYATPVQQSWKGSGGETRVI